jgi:hypothetical protein
MTCVRSGASSCVQLRQEACKLPLATGLSQGQCAPAGRAHWHRRSPKRPHTSLSCYRAQHGAGCERSLHGRKIWGAKINWQIKTQHECCYVAVSIMPCIHVLWIARSAVVAPVRCVFRPLGVTTCWLRAAARRLIALLSSVRLHPSCLQVQPVRTHHLHSLTHTITRPSTQRAELACVLLL